MQIIGRLSGYCQRIDNGSSRSKLCKVASTASRDALPNTPLSRSKLLLAVDKHLQDQIWVNRILNASTENAENFTSLYSVTSAALNEIPDQSARAEIVKKYYQE